MFNITQVGNRVDIDSEGIDFNITPAYVSGTYLQIANIEAEGYDWDVSYSGTLIAHVELIGKINGGIIRTGWPHFNIPQLVYSSIDEGESRRASISSGTVTNIGSNSAELGNRIYPGPFVCQDNYIYYPYHANGSLYLKEYDIKSNTTRTLFVVASEFYEDWIGTGEATLLALIGPRRVLVYDDYDYDREAENPNYYFYIVNFNDNTVTNTFSIPQYENNFNYTCYIGRIAAVNRGGIIHLLIWGTCTDETLSDKFGVFVYHNDGVNGWIRYLSYRTGGSDLASNSVYNMAISGNRYLCLFGAYSGEYWDTFYVRTAWCYDIQTQTLGYATADTYPSPPFSWYYYQTMNDPSDGCVYVTHGVAGGYVFNIYKFNPAAMTYAQAGTNGFLTQNKDRLHTWQSDGSFRKTSDASYYWTATRPTYPYQIARQIDDDMTVWFVDGTHVKAIDVNGDVIRDIDTGIALSGIVHLGKKLLLFAINSNVVTYYLMT